jgi:secreted Zn-dependent insulinase-like peptidase
MRVVLTGRHDIDQLEKWAHEKFSTIVNKDVTVPELGTPAPYDEKNTGYIYRFVPIKDKDIITIYWFLPYT